MEFQSRKTLNQNLHNELLKATKDIQEFVKYYNPYFFSKYDGRNDIQLNNL